MDVKQEEKKERLLAALDKGMVMVHLDARRPGVLVPPHLRNESHLRLNLSYRFDPPDLSVGEWGVRSTLSFSGERFTVAIPWTALFAVTSYVTREFWLYPDDMPKEIIEQTLATEKAPMPRPKTQLAATIVAPMDSAFVRPRVVLREVAPPVLDAEPTTLSGSAPIAVPPAEETPPPRPRPHLRLVK